MFIFFNLSLNNFFGEYRLSINDVYADDYNHNSSGKSVIFLSNSLNDTNFQIINDSNYIEIYTYDSEFYLPLINEIKVLQKDVVHHLDRKSLLKEKEQLLNSYPIYREYINTVDEINNIYNIIENNINNYFVKCLN